MALFKIFRGQSSDLNSIPPHEGYAYFCEDDGCLYIDTSNEEGSRVQVNAGNAQYLKRLSDGEEFDIDDVFLKTEVIPVTAGGTGLSTLIANAILVGNGEAVKLVSLTAGKLVVGDAEDGIKSFVDEGALYNDSTGVHAGNLPVSHGGTGADTASGARTNLDVYSKSEVDNLAGKGSSAAFTATLAAANWSQDGSVWVQWYANTNLKCGEDGSVPPIVSCTSNQDEYNYIVEGDASAQRGISFKASQKPTGDIGIVIVDVR